MKIRLGVMISMILIICDSLVNSQCNSNLECAATTLCCKSNKCTDQSYCIKDTIYSYIGCGVAGLVFLFGIFIYFIITIRECRSRVEEMRKNLLF